MFKRIQATRLIVIPNARSLSNVSYHLKKMEQAKQSYEILEEIVCQTQKLENALAKLSTIGNDRYAAELSKIVTFVEKKWDELPHICGVKVDGFGCPMC